MIICFFGTGHVLSPGHGRGLAAGPTAEVDREAGLAPADRTRPADHIHVPDRGPVLLAAALIIQPHRLTEMQTKQKFPMLGLFFNNTFIVTLFIHIFITLLFYYIPFIVSLSYDPFFVLFLLLKIDCV